MICMHWWALAGFLLGIVTLIFVIVRVVYRNAFKIGYRAGALRANMDAAAAAGRVMRK